MTVSRQFLAKLEAATEALSHAKPGAGMEEILEAGLDLLLEQRARRKGLVATNERCGSRVRLEFDHVMPRALGGPSTADTPMRR
jgi:hypothetical protein